VPLALRSLLQLDQGDRYGNCEEGRSGQEGRSGEEGGPREEGGPGEEGRSREEGSAGQEGGGEEGGTREEGSAGQEGGGEEGRSREEGGAGEEGRTCEEGRCCEEACYQEGRGEEGSKEGGTRYSRCASRFCTREDDAEPRGGLALPYGQQALTSQDRKPSSRLRVRFPLLQRPSCAGPSLFRRRRASTWVRYQTGELLNVATLGLCWITAAAPWQRA